MSVDHLQRAIDLMELKKFDLAAREIRQELSQNPENAEAHYYLALALWKLNKTKDALKPAKEAIRLNPEFAHAYCLLAQLYDEIGKFKEAKTLYLKTIHMMPDESSFYVWYAYHLYLCFPAQVPVIYPHTPLWNEWNNAIKLLEQGLNLNPHHDGAYRIRAMWLGKIQRFSEAHQDLRKALEIDPNNPASHEILGDIYLAEFRSSQAFSAYREALRLNPDNKGLKIKLIHSLEARIPWIGALWRLSWGQPGGWRGGLLAVLVSIPFMVFYAAGLPQFQCAYLVIMALFFFLLNTVGNSLLTLAVIKGWIKV